MCVIGGTADVRYRVDLGEGSANQDAAEGSTTMLLPIAQIILCALVLVVVAGFTCIDSIRIQSSTAEKMEGTALCV